MLNLRPMTAEERDMLNGPTLQSQLPVMFDNGNKFTQINAQCKQCGCTGLEEDTHGTVTRPFPQVALLKGVAWCRHCKILTPFEWRLHDDLRVSGLLDGKWVQRRLQRPPGLIARALRWIFSTPPVHDKK